MRILTDHFYNLLFRLCDARMRVLCFFCNLFCYLPDLFCNLFCNLTDLFCNLELNLYSHAVRIEGLLENRLFHVASPEQIQSVHRTPAERCSR